MGTGQKKIVERRSCMTGAVLNIIVHVEDRSVEQREAQDAARKENERSIGSILVAVAPCNAGMQS